MEMLPFTRLRSNFQSPCCIHVRAPLLRRSAQRTTPCARRIGCEEKARDCIVTSSRWLASWLVPAVFFCAASAGHASEVDWGLTADGGLKPCASKSSCVSTASFRSPSQYLPAWSYYPDSQEKAMQELVDYVRDAEVQGEAELLKLDKEKDYLAARIRFKLASQNDWDVVEMLVRPNGMIAFRAQSEVDLPSPPGCFLRGCISGPRTRVHMTMLQDNLGFPSFESNEDSAENSQWVPLLLH